MRGLELIKVRDEQNAAAVRFCCVLLMHELEALSARDVFGLRSGQGKRTRAIEDVAKTHGVDLRTLQAYIEMSSNYADIMNDYGPGFLLEIGNGVNKT